MTSRGIGSGRREAVANPIARGHVLDEEQLVLQGPFERLPDEGIHQDRLDLHDQVAAVGLQQGAGLNHGEIGGHGPHVGPFLDPAEYIVIGRIGFENHRRARQTRAVHQDVDGSGSVNGAVGLDNLSSSADGCGGRKSPTFSTMSFCTHPDRPGSSADSGYSSRIRSSWLLTTKRAVRRPTAGSPFAGPGRGDWHRPTAVWISSWIARTIASISARCWSESASKAFGRKGASPIDGNGLVAGRCLFERQLSVLSRALQFGEIGFSFAWRSGAAPRQPFPERDRASNSLGRRIFRSLTRRWMLFAKRAACPALTGMARGR